MGRAAMRALLRGDDGEAESGAGAVLPLAADRVFRRHRPRARDCVAGSRFAGAAEFSGCRVEGDAARSLDPVAHAATDRCQTRQAVLRWVLELLAEKNLLKGKTIGIDATTLEANA